jgi:hypothetical protein
MRNFNIYILLVSVRKTEITAVGIRRTDHTTHFYPQNLALTSPTSCGCSIGIVCSQTKATELYFIYSIVVFE